MKLDHAITDFVISLSMNDGKADNTIESYERDLRHYQKFLVEKGIEEAEEIKDVDISSDVMNLFCGVQTDITQTIDFFFLLV